MPDLIHLVCRSAVTASYRPPIQVGAGFGTARRQRHRLGADREQQVGARDRLVGKPEVSLHATTQDLFAETQRKPSTCVRPADDDQFPGAGRSGWAGRLMIARPKQPQLVPILKPSPPTSADLLTATRRPGTCSLSEGSAMPRWSARRSTSSPDGRSGAIRTLTARRSPAGVRTMSSRSSCSPERVISPREQKDSAATA